jgi:hypothetical protein
MSAANTPKQQIETAEPGQASATRVAGREVVSPPAKTIQVERIRISERQRSSVAAAIRPAVPRPVRQRDNAVTAPLLPAFT